MKLTVELPDDVAERLMSADKICNISMTYVIKIFEVLKVALKRREKHNA